MEARTILMNMFQVRRLAFAFIVLFVLAVSPYGSAWAATDHGIAMHGQPLYEPGFANFSYVNPQAPKGGTIVFGALGSFDSLNPLIVKGNAADSIRGLVYESLMARSFDEPFSLYGLLAEKMEVPDDRSWVEFTLRAEARFSDGTPVSVEDVLFTHALLRDRGRPNHRTYYSKVVRAEQTGPRSLRFTFDDSGDREMPLIMGLMPIVPKHLIDPETFEETTLKAPVGSGPYVVEKVDPGARITYRRDPDYWGRDLSVNRGRYNFDEVAYEYYRDDNALFEAFKKGLVDVRQETDPGRWAQAYEFPALADGRVVKEEIANGVPSGMSALVFNTRRPVFADVRVRKALIYLFDFEWINRTLFHGAYARTQSYFDKSELGSAGRPASPAERELLAPYPGAVDPAVMEGSYRLPQSDGSGRNRANRRAAIALLKEAGYRLDGGRMVDAKTGAPLEFEMLVVTKDQERLALTYARALAKTGITMRVRQVDAAQYQQRRQTYDYDMIQNRWYASLSPGNEQSFYWGSQAADAEGSRNYMGAKSEAIDAMIEALVAARAREDFVAAARALDRVLLSGFYVLPLYHLPNQWLARWTRIQRPQTTSLYGIMTDTWWDQDASGATWEGN